MSSKFEEFNFQKIAAWALVIAVGSIAFVYFAIAIARSAGASSKPTDQEAVAARIAPVAKVKLEAGDGGPKAERTGEALYSTACLACHATGAAGAPKLGDTAAWAPRLKLGLDGLLKSAIAGKNAMPPKGGAADATDTELARAIVHMANQSGGKLAEPK